MVLALLSAHCQELELLGAGLLLGSEEVGVTVLSAGQPLEEQALVCARLAGSSTACLGAGASLMRRRLRQCLAGQLDT